MYFPVGVSDFKKLIEYKNPSDGKGYLFVDKTHFIKEISDDGSEAIVITRPRRFGKTINLSMLSYFYDIENAKENKHIFNGLNISKEKTLISNEQGKYPVIFISFKGVKQATYGEAHEKISHIIRELYVQNKFLLGGSAIGDEDRLDFKSVLSLSASSSTLTSSLKNLSKLLNDHHGVPPIVLIDEYDTPIHAAYLNDYYDEMIAFMRDILGEALKDNSYIHKAVLTGILRVSKESIFSGLNNVEVYSLLAKEYQTCFGFTEQEVIEVFERSNFNPKMKEVKSWYNGYVFGDTTIYNPWSIIKYAKSNGELENYWANTSSNELIKKTLINSDGDTKERVMSLINGEEVTEAIDEHLSFQDLDQNRAAIWSLFLMSGYLKVIKKTKDELYGTVCTMKIPNKEVESIYIRTFRDWVSGGKGILWYQDLLCNLKSGNMSAFKEQLEYVLSHIVSTHDVTKKTQESFYHGVAIGLVSGLKNDYYIQSNRESGQGRYDLAIIPKNGHDMAIIMEFKSISKDDKKSLTREAKKALQQIDEKSYLSEAQDKTTGNILTIGISFSGKSLAIAEATHRRTI